MAYDSEPNTIQTEWASRPQVDGRDLEVIVTLLEVAAVMLTPKRGATFAAEDLIGKARELAGDDTEIFDEDLESVLGKAGFLKKHSNGQFSVR